MTFIVALLTVFAWADTGPIRVTKIAKFPKSYGAIRPVGASHCVGKIKVGNKRLPWIENQLAKGVDCVVADFDGNGVQDYALLRNGWSNDVLNTMATDVVVLMFGPKGLEHTFALGSDLKVSEIELAETEEKRPALAGGEGGMFYFKDGQFTRPPVNDEED